LVRIARVAQVLFMFLGEIDFPAAVSPSKQPKTGGCLGEAQLLLAPLFPAFEVLDGVHFLCASIASWAVRRTRMSLLLCFAAKAGKQ
jgi:hypothetical protein